MEWKSRLLLDRERFIEEYDLADLIVVLSEKAAETFRVKNFPEEKLFYLPRGVDIDRFKPGARPPVFRAIFSGALIERKGIHHLLEAWHRLDLKNAELWLVGTVHEEAKPYLQKYWRDNIRTIGFARDPETYLKQGSIYVFPSQWEGSAKTVYEAAACGLPAITTREAGDVIRDGIEGIIVQPGDVDAIAAAIRQFYDHPEMVERMGQAARERVVQNFTWDHYRARLLDAYRAAIQKRLTAPQRGRPDMAIAIEPTIAASSVWRDILHAAPSRADVDKRAWWLLTCSDSGAAEDIALLNILLIQLKRIGDLILTTPAISALRTTFPDARLSLVVSRDVAGLVPAIKEIDQTFAVRRNLADVGVAMSIALKKFDSASILPGTIAPLSIASFPRRKASGLLQSQTKGAAASSRL